MQPSTTDGGASTITLDAEQRARVERQMERFKAWESTAEREGQAAEHLRSLEPQDILRAAHEVRAACSLPGGTSPAALDELRVKQCRLAAQFPVLFDKCCDPGFPLEMLPMLLSQMVRLRTEQVTHEDATDRVCGALNRRYVDPVVDALPKPPVVNDDG